MAVGDNSGKRVARDTHRAGFDLVHGVQGATVGLSGRWFARGSGHVGQFFICWDVADELNAIAAVIVGARR